MDGEEQGAGAVYAGYFRVMGANTLYLSLLLFLLSMLVVGGLGSAWGPLLGVAALMLVDEALKETIEYRDIGLGAILVIMVMVWPTGIAGAIETAWRRIKETKARRKPAPKIGRTPVRTPGTS